MTRRQSAVHDMILTVRQFLSEHQAGWNILPPFVDAEALLQSKHAQLQEAIKASLPDNGSTAATKAARRAELIIPLTKLSAAACSLAAATGDTLLELLLYTTPSELSEISDDAFRGRVYLMLEQVQPYLSDLPPHGLHTTDVPPIEALFLQWRQAEVACVKQRAEQKKATADVGRILREMTSLISSRMDPLATVISSSNHDFAGLWKGVRKIVDPATHTRALQLRVTTLVGGVSQPVSGAVAVINPGAVRKKTAEEGIFYVQRLKPGVYTVEVSAPGYKDSGPISFVTNKGEGADVEVVLESEDYRGR